MISKNLIQESISKLENLLMERGYGKLSAQVYGSGGDYQSGKLKESLTNFLANTKDFTKPFYISFETGNNYQKFSKGRDTENTDAQAIEAYFKVNLKESGLEVHSISGQTRNAFAQRTAEKTFTVIGNDAVPYREVLNAAIVNPKIEDSKYLVAKEDELNIKWGLAVSRTGFQIHYNNNLPALTVGTEWEALNLYVNNASKEGLSEDKVKEVFGEKMLKHLQKETEAKVERVYWTKDLDELRKSSVILHQALSEKNKTTESATYTELYRHAFDQKFYLYNADDVNAPNAYQVSEKEAFNIVSKETINRGDAVYSEHEMRQHFGKELVDEFMVTYYGMLNKLPNDELVKHLYNPLDLEKIKSLIRDFQDKRNSIQKYDQAASDALELRKMAEENKKIANKVMENLRSNINHLIAPPANELVELKLHSQKMHQAWRDELLNGVSDKSEKLREEFESFNKKHFPVLVKTDTNPKYAIIDFEQISGWADMTIFHKEEKGNFIPNDLGKEVKIDRCIGAWTQSFDFNLTNAQKVVNALQDHGYKVQCKGFALDTKEQMRSSQKI